MKDDDDVINLNNVRRDRERALGEALHQRGEAFKFLEWRYDDDAIGITEGDVCLVLGDDLDGIVMGPADARKLAAALNEAADSAEKQGA